MKTASFLHASTLGALAIGTCWLCWIAWADVQTPSAQSNLVPLRRLDQSGATNGQTMTWNASFVNEDNSLGRWTPGAPGASLLSPYASNVISGGSIPVGALPFGFKNLIWTNALANQTNLWGAGGAVATNNVDFNVSSQSYSTLTPYNFSGIIAPTNADEGETLIQISNISTTNVTGTWPAQFVLLVNGTLATSCTTTNGTTEYFWFHFTTANNGKRTNGVANQL